VAVVPTVVDVDVAAVVGLVDVDDALVPDDPHPAISTDEAAAMKTKGIKRIRHGRRICNRGTLAPELLMPDPTSTFTSINDLVCNQTGYLGLGREADVSVRPRHISSEDPSPHVTK
jgi:hypothetical protein